MRIAVAGLGNMGVRIAERVLAAGHALTVYNRSPAKAASLVEKGATAAAAPRDLLAANDVCITVLADDRALEAVTLTPDGILAAARPGTVLVDMSTVSVAASSRVAAGGAAAGGGHPGGGGAGGAPGGGGGASPGGYGPERLLRRRSRAGPRRQAGPPGDDRRYGGAPVGGARPGRSGRRQPPDAARGDRRLSGGLAVRQVQERALARGRLLGHLHDGDDEEGSRARPRLRPRDGGAAADDERARGSPRRRDRGRVRRPRLHGALPLAAGARRRAGWVAAHEAEGLRGM